MNDQHPPRLTPEEIERIARSEASGHPINEEQNEFSRKAEEQYREAMKENAPYLTLGMQMALTIALGAGIGWWVDKQSGNSMWLGIGAGIGAVLGMGYFILVVLRIDSKTKPKKHK